MALNLLHKAVFFRKKKKKNAEEKYNSSLIYFAQVYDCLVLDTYALIILKSLILTTSS